MAYIVQRTARITVADVLKSNNPRGISRTAGCKCAVFGWKEIIAPKAAMNPAEERTSASRFLGGRAEKVVIEVSPSID
jgi:hypothetical protein